MIFHQKMCLFPELLASKRNWVASLQNRSACKKMAGVSADLQSLPAAVLQGLQHDKIVHSLVKNCCKSYASFYSDSSVNNFYLVTDTTLHAGYRVVVVKM